MDSVVQGLLNHGVLGLMCLLLVLWIYSSDRNYRSDRSKWDKQTIADREAADKHRNALQDELATEQRARVEDAQRYTKLALELQGQAVEACQGLRSHLDEYRRIANLVESVVRILREEESR
jgi:hypothetical protein